MCGDLVDLEARSASSLRQDTPLQRLYAAAGALREQLIGKGSRFIARASTASRTRRIAWRRHLRPLRLEPDSFGTARAGRHRKEQRPDGGPEARADRRHQVGRAGVRRPARGASIGRRRLHRVRWRDRLGRRQAPAAQMLASVDSMFTRLYCTLAAARLRILGQLESDGAGPVLGGGVVGAPVDAAGRFGELRLIDDATLTELLEKAAIVAAAAPPAKSLRKSSAKAVKKAGRTQVKKSPPSWEAVVEDGRCAPQTRGKSRRRRARRATHAHQRHLRARAWTASDLGAVQDRPGARFQGRHGPRFQRRHGPGFQRRHGPRFQRRHGPGFQGWHGRRDGVLSDLDQELAWRGGCDSSARWGRRCVTSRRRPPTSSWRPRPSPRIGGDRAGGGTRADDRHCSIFSAVSTSLLDAATDGGARSAASWRTAYGFRRGPVHRARKEIRRGPGAIGA